MDRTTVTGLPPAGTDQRSATSPSPYTCWPERDSGPAVDPSWAARSAGNSPPERAFHRARDPVGHPCFARRTGSWRQYQAAAAVTRVRCPEERISSRIPAGVGPSDARWRPPLPLTPSRRRMLAPKEPVMFSTAVHKPPGGHPVNPTCRTKRGSCAARSSTGTSSSARRQPGFRVRGLPHDGPAHERALGRMRVAASTAPQAPGAARASSLRR